MDFITKCKYLNEAIGLICVSTETKLCFALKKADIIIGNFVVDVDNTR